jgi:hypothetical protein
MMDHGWLLMKISATCWWFQNGIISVETYSWLSKSFSKGMRLYEFDLTGLYLVRNMKVNLKYMATPG